MLRSLPFGRSHPHHRAPQHLALQIPSKRRWQVGEINNPGDDAVEMPRFQITRDAPPDLQPDVAWSGGGVDAQQTHASQDERHYGCLELRAARQTHARDVSPEIYRARQPCERFTADVVDGTREL